MPETMSDNLLLRLVLAQAQSVDDALNTWQPPRQPSPSDTSVSRLVSIGVRIYEDAESAYAEGYVRAVKDSSLTLSDLQRERQAFAGAFRIAAQAVYRLGECLDSIVQATGHPIEESDRLRRTAQQFHELQARLAAEWPVGDPEEVQQMREENERARGMELDEAFAEIAGLDKPAWLERVAEHKRKRPRDG